MNLTFLNVLFLAGMAAGIVPIVIHLLSRRRLKRIEFSDLRFLAPLNQQRMRSLNLRRLLLLALRVAIVVFTAVAMARPSVRGTFSRLLPAQARSSVLLLVDTSYSMRAEGENGTALDQAKLVAHRILDVLERGDEVNIMTFDRTVRPEFQTAVHDLDLVRARVDALQASHSRADWGRALAVGLRSLASATEANRELYLLSDFAGVDMDSLQMDLSGEQRDVRVTLVPVQVEPFVNVSIDEVQVPPGAVLLEDPVRIGVTVQNHAADAPADCALQIELGGQPKGEASLRLGAAAQRTHEFTLVATQPDAIAGVVRKRVDRLPEDDVRYFVLPVLAQLRVLLVEGPGSAGDAGGSFFVSRALAPTRGRSPLQLSEVEVGRFSSRDLDGVQVAVVSSDALLGESQAQILVDFVRDGGGLLLFAGQRRTADLANRLLLERLGAARLRGIVQSEQGYVNLADLRPTGILAGFKEPELRVLEGVKFSRYAELATGGDARAVLKFSGGAPAIIEGDHGNGEYMLVAFDAGLDGSDLAVSPMFLPLLHRSIVSLAGETGRQKLSSLVGERTELEVPIAAPGRQARAAGDSEERWAQAGTPDGGVRPEASSGAGPEHTFTVTTPSGRKEALVAHYVGRMAIVSYEDTSEPGHYVFEGEGHRLARAVNIDTRESDLRVADLDAFARGLHLKIGGRIGGPDDVARSVREARHGKELYKLVIVMVLALLTAELFLSRGGSSEPEPVD